MLYGVMRVITPKNVITNLEIGKDFAMKDFIKPDVINILCSDTAIDTKPPIPIVAPQVPKQSFWGRIGRFFKKAVTVVISIIIAVPPFINAIARYRNTHKPELQMA
jgi:hypothetical protein